jgi:hypothetical protein
MNKPRKLRAELEYRVTRAALKRYMEALSESLNELEGDERASVISDYLVARRLLEGDFACP